MMCQNEYDSIDKDVNSLDFTNVFKNDFPYYEFYDSSLRDKMNNEFFNQIHEPSSITPLVESKQKVVEFIIEKIEEPMKNDIKENNEENKILIEDYEKFIDNIENEIMEETKKNTEDFQGKKRRRNRKKKEPKPKIKAVDSKKGRKKKGSTEDCKHDKNSNDNIILKIKTSLMNSIQEFINTIKSDYIQENGLGKKTKNKSIFKIISKTTKDLNSKVNIELLKKTMKEIYEENETSIKCKRENNSENIKKLIEDKNGPLIFKGLDIKLGEYLKAFRGEKDALNRLEEIVGQEKMKNFKGIKDLLRKELLPKIEEIEKSGKSKEEKENEKKVEKKYGKKILELCSKYEEWFSNRKERARRTNTNK